MSKKPREFDSEFGFQLPSYADEAETPLPVNPCILLLVFFATIGVISLVSNVADLVSAWLW